MKIPYILLFEQSFSLTEFLSTKWELNRQVLHSFYIRSARGHILSWKLCQTLGYIKIANKQYIRICHKRNTDKSFKVSFEIFCEIDVDIDGGTASGFTRKSTYQRLTFLPLGEVICLLIIFYSLIVIIRNNLFRE